MSKVLIIDGELSDAFVEAIRSISGMEGEIFYSKPKPLHPYDCRNFWPRAPVSLQESPDCWWPLGSRAARTPQGDPTAPHLMPI